MIPSDDSREHPHSYSEYAFCCSYSYSCMLTLRRFCALNKAQYLRLSGYTAPSDMSYCPDTPIVCLHTSIKLQKNGSMFLEGLNGFLSFCIISEAKHMSRTHHSLLAMIIRVVFIRALLIFRELHEDLLIA